MRFNNATCLRATLKTKTLRRRRTPQQSCRVFDKNKDDQIYGPRVAEMAKIYSSEAFYAIDEPLEAAIRNLGIVGRG
jgi:hypothetical protein